MRISGWLAAVAVLCLGSLSARAGSSLSPAEALKHVGQNATVCGIVASAHHGARRPAQPTFLNLGKPYPHEIFTAVIFASDRAKFGKPEVRLEGKRICVTGLIRTYRKLPEIILHDPKQLKLDE